MKVIPTILEDHEIRRLYNEWFFSVVDIVQILTQQLEYKTAEATGRF